MRIGHSLSRLPLLLVAVLAAATAHGGTKPDAKRQAVAVIYAMKGRATLQESGAGRRSVEVLDWLYAGSVLTVRSGSVSVALADGRRYELAAGTSAAFGPAGLETRTGSARPLEPVSPFPGLKGVVSGEIGESAATGILHIRAEPIRRLYPAGGFAVRSKAASLSFQAVEGATRYEISIKGPSGETLFKAETTKTVLDVPSSILPPGSELSWTVRSLDKPGATARGDADFTTLSAAAESEREALRASLEKEGDPASRTLLAEADRRFGLLREAREELEAALARAPGSPGLTRALEQVRQTLAALDPDR